MPWMPVQKWYNSGQMVYAPIIFAAILTNAASLVEAVYGERIGVGFDIEGVVTLPNKRGSWIMAIEDDSGGVLLRNHSPKCDTVFFKPGERLRLCGKTTKNNFGSVLAECTQAVVTAVLPAPVPRPASIGEILDGTFDNKLIQITGTVREVFNDEIDQRWIYLILNCDGQRIAVTFVSESADAARFAAMTDATITVSGVCYLATGLRRLLGRYISCLGPEAISVVSPAPVNPFDVPAIGNEKRISPSEVDKMGRRRMNGRVAAVWSDHNFLLEDAAGECHRIELMDDGPPTYGEYVEVTGLPSTDLYNIHLGSGLWRPTTNETSAVKAGDAAPVLTSDDFHDKKFGRINRFMKHNGRTARFNGTVVGIELGKTKYRNCTILCEDFTINVNSGTAGDLPESVAIGSQVEVTGTCITHAGTWHPSVSFPHVEDTPTVVLRHPEDIKVVAGPPWWTPLRLLVAFVALLALMAAILLWAIALKFVAERRSRQLFKAEIGKAEETLRVGERTRLAVELHDTIAQNLTGAAFQIEAAKDATEPGSEAVSYLTCAEQILKSCRTELRRCIWDLKSNALEVPDLNAAILATVRPIAGNADVHIRFNVPRSRISDVTAHALLRIIRELVANAVHHGHATRIRIAGEIADERLRFSVSDNGCGFDPESCPGPSTGHFGLDGIRERVDAFEGEFSLETAQGKGTRVTVAIGTTKQPCSRK